MSNCESADGAGRESNEFRFKQFSVKQNDSAMKVNTDGVLLASWVSVDNDQKKGFPCRILDIGTGTGVISLILAQRLSQKLPLAEFFIEGIDIDKPSSVEASFNFKNSPWSEKISSEWISLVGYFQKYGTNKRFELIIANPPFFTSSLRCPGERRSRARHDHDLPYDEIIESASLMLAGSGTLALILPPQESMLFVERAREIGLMPKRICRVKTLASGKEKRWMIEFGLNYKSSPKEEQIAIQETAGKDFTSEYKELTKNFYLNF